MDKPYENREIDHMFNDIKETLERIEEQTTRTNGRVTSLEKWMWTVIGGLSILAFLVGNQMLNI